jgi:hypothetical protein
LLAVLDSPLSPFPDDGSLAFPYTWRRQTSEDQGLHVALMRDINLDGIIMVTHSKHNCDCGMYIASLK